MHKNTLLLTALFATIAMFLVGVQVGRNLPRTIVTTPPVEVSPTPTPVTITMKSYTDTTCGVSLKYPDNLQVLESTNSGTLFVNEIDPLTSVVVLCQNEIPRVPLTDDKIESKILRTTSGATVSATLYHDASAQDGTPTDKLIFTHPTKNIDVLVGGYGAIYNALITTLQIQ